MRVCFQHVVASSLVEPEKASKGSKTKLERPRIELEYTSLVIKQTTEISRTQGELSGARPGRARARLLRLFLRFSFSFFFSSFLLLLISHIILQTKLLLKQK